MNKVRHTARAALIGASVLATSLGVMLSDVDTARAVEDGKLVSGLSCQPAVGSPGTIAYSVSGYVYNNSSTDLLTVLCPMINDPVVGPITFDDEQARVYLYDGNDADGIDCWIRSSSAASGIVWSVTASTTNGFTGWSDPDFGDTGDPTYFPDVDDVMFMECDLPALDGSARSRIYGVHYVEVE